MSKNFSHMTFALTSKSNQPRFMESEVPGYQHSISTSNWPTSMESEMPWYTNSDSTSYQHGNTISEVVLPWYQQTSLGSKAQYVATQYVARDHGNQSTMSTPRVNRESGLQEQHRQRHYQQKGQIKVGPIIKSEGVVHIPKTSTGKLSTQTSDTLDGNSNMAGKQTTEGSRDRKGRDVNRPICISPAEKPEHVGVEMSRGQPPKTSPQRPPRNRQKQRKDDKQLSKGEKSASEEKTIHKYNGVKQQPRDFWPDYVNLKEEEEATKLSTLNIVIFGLHEKSGDQMFQKLFRCDQGEILKQLRTRKKKREFTFKSKEQSHDFEVSVFVSPLQYADYSLRSTVYDVRRLYKAVRCFVVVFDANFVRFSSDVKRAMTDLEKKYFGPNIWKNAVLIILNSDDVIGKGTVETYLNRQGNENLKYYVDKMDGRVIALPKYEEDYDPTHERNLLMKAILTLHEDYVPQTLWGKFLKTLEQLFR